MFGVFGVPGLDGAFGVACFDGVSGRLGAEGVPGESGFDGLLLGLFFSGVFASRSSAAATFIPQPTLDPNPPDNC